MTGYPWTQGDLLLANDLNAAIADATAISGPPGSTAGWPFLPLTGGAVTGPTSINALFATAGASYTFGAGGTSTFDFIQSGTGNIRFTLGGPASIFMLRGANSNTMFRVNSTSAPVNYLALTPSNTGANLFVDTNGTDTNVSLVFRAQGSGNYQFNAPLQANNSFVQSYPIAVGSLGLNAGTGFRQNTSISGSANMPSWLAYNQWNVSSDTAAMTGYPMWHTGINYNFGGAGFSGNRGGLWVNMTQAGAVSGSSGAGGINALATGVNTSSTFGGTNPGPGALGAVFAANFILNFLAGSTNLQGGQGLEIDGSAAAGTTYQSFGGVSLVTTTAHKQPGITRRNTAVSAGGQANSIGWDIGYAIDSWGLQAGSTIFNADFTADNGASTFPVARGFDLRIVQPTGDAFATAGFAVGPTGRVRVGTGFLDVIANGVALGADGAICTGGTLTVAVTTVYAADGNHYWCDDPYGGVWAMIFTSGSTSVTAVSMIVAGAVKGAAPSNPVTLTPRGRLRIFQPGAITANLTWDTSRTTLSIQPSGAPVLTNLSAAATDAAAATAGVPIGGLYNNAGVVHVRLT